MSIGMKDLFEDISDFLFFIIPVTLVTLVGVLIRPIWGIFDRRRFKIIPNHYNRGLGRFYCYLHYALKDTGSCPNCGISQRELLK